MAASRLPALAGVAAAHVAALLALLSLTRPHAVAAPDLTSVLIWLPDPVSPVRRMTPESATPARAPASRPRNASSPSASVAPTPENSSAIDWTAAGEAAA